jgi:hypothetical protein
MTVSDQIESTESRQRHESQSVDLVVGITGPAEPGQLRARAAEALYTLIAEMSAEGPPLRVAVASAGVEGVTAESDPADIDSPVHFVEYSLASNMPRALPWLSPPAAHRALARLAASVNARACLMLAEDLTALDRDSIEALADPLMEGSAQLTMPLYPAGRYEGLVNSSILYPFTRALYGRQLRYPLALDFGVAGPALARLAAEPMRGQSTAICWPGVEGAIANVTMAQVFLKTAHNVRNDGLELSTVLGLLAASLFEDAEGRAAVWQRVRGSRPVPAIGNPAAALEDGDGVDTQPLLESFNLALRNLQEVWSPVLPPVTLLELRRIARLPPEEFRLPDTLWARMIYDFALAYRLRTISRTHLLGALTPLYLGWVASYAAEVRTLDAEAAERRVERLAAAFEEAKPYFVSRWRWPDRFNP